MIVSVKYRWMSANKIEVILPKDYSLSRNNMKALASTIGYSPDVTVVINVREDIGEIPFDEAIVELEMVPEKYRSKG